MEPAMKKTKKEIEQHEQEMAILSSADRLNRARSITVGTAFNGVTEIMMRGDGKYIWCILQPAEVTELIHQLAANIGCHIHIQPRDDFSSWRKWRELDDKPLSTNFPPFANFPPLAQERLNLDYSAGQLAKKEIQDEQAVAIEKTL